MKTITVYFLSLVLLLIVSCTGKDTTVGPNNKSYGVAKISISSKSSVIFNKLARKAILEISAGDMVTISTELSLSDSAVTGTVTAIPAGLKRHFEISILDSAGVKQYYGDSYVDVIADKTITVEINIQRLYLGSATINGNIIEQAVTAGIKMVTIPEGIFQMGSSNEGESPIHTVSISSFLMAATEITEEQYKNVIGFLPKYQDISGDKYPICSISWKGAAFFCNMLSKIEGYEKCYNETTWDCDLLKNGYRLPTEAEWEYTCKAGTSTVYYTGNDISDLYSAGWFLDNNTTQTVHPVGQKIPNSWGLFDMHGNVWEYCNDWYGAYESGSFVDPTGPLESNNIYANKVMRGGSCYNTGVRCSSTYRVSISYAFDFSSTTKNDYGFRIVRRP